MPSQNVNLGEGTYGGCKDIFNAYYYSIEQMENWEDRGYNKYI